MKRSTETGFNTAIQISLLALVAVLGIPAIVYFGFQGAIGTRLANAPALSFSLISALFLVIWLLRQRD